MPNRPTAEQLDRVLNILTNARDAALIDKVAIEIGLETDGLSFMKHLVSAAKAVGAELLPVRTYESADAIQPEGFPNGVLGSR